MTNPSSTIVQRLWKTCNVLWDDRWLEAAVKAGLKRSAPLRQAVLRSAF